MMKHRVTIENTGEIFDCEDERSVLEGMIRLGRRGVPAGCRGGGCGVCKVQVLQGDYRPMPMSSRHVSPEDLSGGRVLACRIRPDSDLTLKVIGKMTRAWGRSEDGHPSAERG